MSKTLVVVPIRGKEEAETREALESMLELHREGRLKGFVVAAELDDGDYRIGLFGRCKRRPMEALGLCSRAVSIVNRIISDTRRRGYDTSPAESRDDRAQHDHRSF